MNRVLLSVFLFGLLSSTGCMVIDELDSANAKMDALSGSKAEEVAEESPSDAGSILPSKDEFLKQSKELWRKAADMTRDKDESKIVTCRLREGTQFMSKDDCLVRGGVPSDVSS